MSRKESIVLVIEVDKAVSGCTACDRCCLGGLNVIEVGAGAEKKEERPNHEREEREQEREKKPDTKNTRQGYHYKFMVSL